MSTNTFVQVIGAARTRPRVSRPVRRRRLLGAAMAAPAIVLVIGFFIWPLTQTIYMSLNDWPLLGEHEFIGFDNYVKVIQDKNFLAAAGFTVVYTAVATPLLLIVGLVLASLVYRGTRLARLFQSIYFLPVCIGFASAGYIFLFMFQSGIGPTTNLLMDLGIISKNTNLLGDKFTAMVVILALVTWKASGLQMLLLLSGMQSIPTELFEAAKIDGARRWQVFLWITLPLLRPTLALVMVFSVAGSLLSFDQFFIVTGGGPSNSTITAVFEVYRTSFIRFDLGYGATQSVLLLVVLAAVSSAQLLLLRNSDHS